MSTYFNFFEIDLGLVVLYTVNTVYFGLAVILVYLLAAPYLHYALIAPYKTIFCIGDVEYTIYKEGSKIKDGTKISSEEGRTLTVKKDIYFPYGKVKNIPVEFEVDADTWVAKQKATFIYQGTDSNHFNKWVAGKYSITRISLGFWFIK